MMKLYKILFFNFLILGSLIAISANSWLGMWMGLEINLFSVIPLFSVYKNIYSTEATMKYFIVQAFASMIFLYSILMLSLLHKNYEWISFEKIQLMQNCALLIKMGSAPFHFWFPEVIEGISWMNSLILLTWQKIAPMILLLNNNLNKTILFLVIVCCSLISTLFIMNQVSMRKLLAFSSINHIGWMISTLLISETAWLIYFTVYSLISINLIYIFKQMNCFSVNQALFFSNQNKLLKISLMMNFLSLGGLPPLIGFFPKWIAINFLINEKMFLLIFILILSSLITLFVYLRIIFSSLVISHIESKIKIKVKLPLLYWFLNLNFMLMLIFATILFNYL
nr:NADH dehydrogenase subunit 2 [Osphya sp. n.]